MEAARYEVVHTERNVNVYSYIFDVKLFSAVGISLSEGQAVDLCFQRKQFSPGTQNSVELSKWRLLFGDNMLECSLGFNSRF